MNQILIITVNYKDTTVTEKFIRSLQHLDLSNDVDLVIVDSESTLQTKEQLEFLVKNRPFKTQLILSEKKHILLGWSCTCLKNFTIELQ